MGLPPTVIAAGISGLASIFGQSQANRENRNLSNTAYQRGMADMKKAGLNPILAYQKGGASTPQMESITKNATKDVATAVQALRADSEIEQIQSQTELNEANTALSLQKAITEQSTQGQQLSQADFIRVQTGLANFEAQTRRINAGGKVSRELKSFAELFQGKLNLPKEWDTLKILDYLYDTFPSKFDENQRQQLQGNNNVGSNPLRIEINP